LSDHASSKDDFRLRVNSEIVRPAANGCDLKSAVGIQAASAYNPGAL
jgi:hypothetical protein